MADDDEIRDRLLVDVEADTLLTGSNKIHPMSINSSATARQSPQLPSKTTSSSPSMNRKPFVPRKGDPLSIRLKYFNEIRKLAHDEHAVRLLNDDIDSRQEFLSPPAHVLPSALFVVGGADVEPGKQARWQTIASIVNTMMGTTIVALPYGVATTGIGLGVFLIGLMGSISCFTCLLLVHYGKGQGEFSSIVAGYLGRYPQLIAWAMSTAIIAGAAIVYHILMQESLYQLVGAVLTAVGNDGQNWKRVYAALVPVAMYPICNLKDMSALVKVNSIGVLFLWYTIIFILYHGFHGASQAGAFVTTTTAPDSSAPFDSSGALIVNLGGTSNFGPLGGMVMLSFFIHNCIQPILKNANQASEKTDIMIAYSITGALYVAVGILGYFGFADANSPAVCAKPNSPCDLNGNFLALFGSTFSSPSDVYAFTARVSLLCQLLTVYPLLLLIIRTQVFGLLKNTTWPGIWWVAGLNAAVMAVTLTFAALDLQISIVLRFTGAIGGLVLIFAIPVAIDLKERRKAGTLSVWRIALHSTIMLIGTVIFIMQFVS